MTTTDKESLLRNIMQREGISAFITPSTDPHSGEYVPERWKSRRWISGFTGSAGTAVVTTDKAALWTDSRYFIQAGEQLAGSDFSLMKEKIEGTPSISEWLGSVLPKGSVVAVDGWVNTVSEVEALQNDLAAYGLSLRTDIDPYAEIWSDRPSVPLSKVFEHEMQYAGESAKSKIERIREKLNGNALLVSFLEDIAWTLNLRADDILYTPFLVSYVIITPSDVTLYIKKEKLTDEVSEYLSAQGISVREYDEIIDGISSIDIPMVIDADKTNYTTFSAVKHPLRKASPIPQTLMFKNETEIRGYHSAMEKDGVAMVKWIKELTEMKHLSPALSNGEGVEGQLIDREGVPQTELTLSAKLEAYRREQPLCMGISFESIMGYGYHGAIVHYDPTPETDIPVKAEGLLLIDSGGQYLDGTTDITRTIPLGPLTWEMQRDYTLVLKGWIDLGSAVFPRGTNGTQLDGFARQAMWKHGINYLHGTGHGVGMFGTVHESIDQHQFRMQWRPTPLLPGMTITCEPGIYIEGSHGVRHENTMLVVESPIGEGITFGPYYQFEALTLCPILTSPILKEMLTKEEIEWFNNYQQMVYDRLSPRLDDEHREWLREVTKAI